MPLFLFFFELQRIANKAETQNNRFTALCTLLNFAGYDNPLHPFSIGFVNGMSTGSKMPTVL